MNQQKIKSMLPLLVLFALFAIFVAQHFNNFYVPDSDFFDYRDKAISIRNFENPGLSKRPPLYAALIGVTSHLFSGRDRELLAAVSISAAAAMACFYLLYRISFAFLGAWSFLLVWMWALHPTTIRMAMKPKGEMLLLAVTLLAFWLYIRKSRLAYWMGFLGTTIRYEGACAVAGIGGSDFFTRKQKLKPVIYSLLAISFLVIWTFLSSSGSEGGSYVNFYSQGSFSLAYLGVILKGTFEFVPDVVYPPAAVFGVLLMLIGLITFIRKQPRETLYLLFYYLGFVAIHIIWFTKNKDYLVVITWDTLLLLGLGGYTGLSFLRKQAWFKRFGFLLKAPWPIILTVLVFLELAALAALQTLSPGFEFRWWAFFGFNAAVLIFALAQFQRNPWPKTLLVLAVSLPVSLGMLRNHSDQFFKIHHAKAEYRLTAEWFADQPDETRLVISQPFIAEYYSDRPAEDFLNLTDLPETTPDSLNSWLREQNVTHVAWLYDNRIYEYDYAWYQWKLATRGWQAIEFLKNGDTEHPGFELVKTVCAGNRYALIYRVVPQNHEVEHENS